MNNTEAHSIILNELAAYREMGYEKLQLLVDTPPETKEIRIDSDEFYQTEIMVCWDDSKERKDIRVIGAIDDGSIRAFSPMSDSFIMAPNGKFIDE